MVADEVAVLDDLVEEELVEEDLAQPVEVEAAVHVVLGLAEDVLEGGLQEERLLVGQEVPLRGAHCVGRDVRLPSLGRNLAEP